LGTFGRVTRLGIAALAALAVLVATPAVAQNPVTVSAKTPGGRTVTLTVRDSGGQRCLSLTHAEEAPRRTAPCTAPPKDAHDDARGLGAVYRGDPEKIAILYGTVSGQTRELKVRLGDGRLLEIRPNRRTGAYLRVISGRPAVATVNAHDASGALRGAADLDPRAVEPIRGPFSLMRTQDERGRRATVTGFAARIYRERSISRPLQACMGIVRRGSPPTSNVEPGYAGGTACTTSTRRLIVRFAAGCESRRLLLFGIVPTAVARLRLITANGARHAVALARFPRAMRHPGRAFVFSATDPGQLTRLEAYARSGERIASLPLEGVGSGCGSSKRS
jgi:hypothetical protein